MYHSSLIFIAQLCFILCSFDGHCIVLFTCSPIDRYLDCFQFGALMCRDTTQHSGTGFCVNICFSFFVVMPRSETDGSHNFIRNCQLFSSVAVPSCIGKTLALVALYLVRIWYCQYFSFHHSNRCALASEWF